MRPGLSELAMEIVDRNSPNSAGAGRQFGQQAGPDYHLLSLLGALRKG